jgi:hypothetical protein
MATLASLALGGLFLYTMNKSAKKGSKDKIDVFRQRDMTGLDRETEEIIKLITFSDSTYPVGSFKYKAHKYPGDVDIFEPVKICCTRQKAIDSIVKELKSIAQKVTNSKKIFWGDFKAGIDYALKPEEGISPLNYLDQISKVKLSLEERQAIMEDVKDGSRSLYVVRWRPEEIIKGVKTLRSGTQLSLAEAITHDSMIKLDLWAPVNGNYTEVTNFFLFSWTDGKGKTEILNAELGDRMESLNKDIVKYGSKEHWNPLKLAKRLWNKALFLDDKVTSNKLYPLFSSGAAKVNQIIAESETIRAMFEKVSNPPTEKLLKQIDGFKRRINDAHDLIISTEEESHIYKLINSAVDGQGDQQTISSLLELEDLIKMLANRYSEQFLYNVGLI